MQTDNSASIQGKIAIVTGGSRGLGQNTVLHLARRGVQLIFTYNSNQAEAEKVVAEVDSFGGRAVALPWNAADVSTFAPFVEEVSSALKKFNAERFDFLVNNAGMSHHASFVNTTVEELDLL